MAPAFLKPGFPFWPSRIDTLIHPGPVCTQGQARGPDILTIGNIRGAAQVNGRQSVFSLAARRKDVGIGRDGRRRDGGLRTSWTKPPPGCSPMGIASSMEIGGRRGRGAGRLETRHGREAHGGWRLRRKPKRGMDRSSHRDQAVRGTRFQRRDSRACGEDGGSDPGHHDVSSLVGRLGGPTRHSTTSMWPL